VMRDLGSPKWRQAGCSDRLPSLLRGEVSEMTRRALGPARLIEDQRQLGTGSRG